MAESSLGSESSFSVSRWVAIPIRQTSPVQREWLCVTLLTTLGPRATAATERQLSTVWSDFHSLFLQLSLSPFLSFHFPASSSPFLPLWTHYCNTHSVSSLIHRLWPLAAHGLDTTQENFNYVAMWTWPLIQSRVVQTGKFSHLLYICLMVTVTLQLGLQQSWCFAIPVIWESDLLHVVPFLQHSCLLFPKDLLRHKLTNCTSWIINFDCCQNEYNRGQQTFG